jgi:hypothetical protein
VFANNRRARDFYARQGYQDDSLRLTKPLSGQRAELLAPDAVACR